MTLQQVRWVNLDIPPFLLLIEHMLVDELLLILLVDDLISLALSEGVVDILDGFEADGLGVATHVEVELLRLHVH